MPWRPRARSAAPTPGADSTVARGAVAERRARWHYRLRGYRVLGVNVRAGRNEVDILLRRGGQLIFCEVKAKSGERFGDPLEMVGAEKQRRIRRAAELWLAGRPELAGLAVRFDIVAVRSGRVQRLPNAF